MLSSLNHLEPSCAPNRTIHGTVPKVALASDEILPALELRMILSSKVRCTLLASTALEKKQKEIR